MGRRRCPTGRLMFWSRPRRHIRTIPIRADTFDLPRHLHTRDADEPRALAMSVWTPESTHPVRARRLRRGAVGRFHVVGTDELGVGVEAGEPVPTEIDQMRGDDLLGRLADI